MKRTLNTTINRSKNEKNDEHCTHSYGYTLTTPSGNTIRRIVERDDYRRSLVTNCVTYFNSSLIDSNVYAFDALSRPTARTTGTTGISPVDSTFAYNNRSEVVSAAIGTNLFTHAYDDIGNHLLFGDNATTNTYTHNNLNQITSLLRASQPLAFSAGEVITAYDIDGNMTQCGDWSFTYDAANQLKMVSSNGVLLVTNFYDAKSRRVKKVTTEATTTFFYDGWNLIEERVVYASGTTSTIRYYWGKDLSGTLQGSGGVGGLLYLTIDGVLYVPDYDNIGNITRYLDVNGNTVAQYTYDAFGGTLSQSGTMCNVFRHRFSTKHLDVETGLYYYGYRFYSPLLMRWINRDSIEEFGGFNLYGFCGNNGICKFDKDGRAYFAKRVLDGQSWNEKTSINPALDKMDWEWSHEQLFYGTPEKPLDDVGYFDDGKVRKDKIRGKYKYVVTSSGYDDCVMRKAVALVKPEKYNVAFAFLPLFDNCQSYAAKLRSKYAELMENERVLCECFGKRKKGSSIWTK